MLPSIREAGTWWAQPNPRLAYYVCLRRIYDMRAIDALAYIRKLDRDYPGFVDDMMGSIKRGLKGKVKYANYCSLTGQG